MLRQGGNEQLQAYFKKLAIENSSISTLYKTRAAARYRIKLKERVDGILSGELQPKIRFQKKPCSNSEKSNLRSESITPVRCKYDLIINSFPEGPMGFTITKNAKGVRISYMKCATSTNFN